MRFGVSSLVVEDLAFEEGVDAIARAGFTQVELTPWGRFGEFWLKTPEPARRLLAAKGLRAVSVHTPEAGWDNDAPDESVRRASVETACSVFAAAVAMGVEVAVVHPNARYTHDFAAADWDANVARSRDSFKALAERAAPFGLRLAAENMPARKTPRPGARVAEILGMIEGLGPRVGLCIDAGHANSNQLSAAEEIRAAGNRLFAVHVQDNDGLGEDQHLLPGEGTTDWPAFLAALDECAPDALCNFEVAAVAGNSDETLAALAALARAWERRTD